MLNARMSRRHQRQQSLGHCWYWLALFAALICSACEQSSPPLQKTGEPGQVRNFTGTWTATGDRQTMELGSGHVTAIFRYSGSLLLSGEQRVNAGFKGEIIGFADSQSGMQGRCTWTDENGDKLFSELHSETINLDQPINGRFIGGTGRYNKVTGEYTFKWQRLIEQEYGRVSGRVVGLKGWIRLYAPAVDQATPGGQ
jgi:hypothetical protein